LVDGWIDTIRDVVEDTESKKNELFDPFDHKLVRRLLPDYLQEIENCKLEIARLEDERTAFEQQGEEAGDAEDDGEDNGETQNYAKELEAEIKELKASVRESLDRIKHLSRGPNVKDKGSIAARKKLGEDTTELEAELARLESEVEPVQGQMKALDSKLAPYEDVKKRLSEQRRRLKALGKALLERLDQAREELSADGCKTLVIELACESLERQLGRYVDEHLREILGVFDVMWDKYGVSLETIVRQRDTTTAAVGRFVEELGYV